MARTQEENILVDIYTLIRKKEGEEKIHISELLRYSKINPKRLSNIINQLAHGNFIRKLPEETLALHPHGIWLVEEELLNNAKP